MFADVLVLLPGPDTGVSTEDAGCGEEARSTDAPGAGSPYPVTGVPAACRRWRRNAFSDSSRAILWFVGLLSE